MYVHRFEYMVITHLIFMVALAVYFMPWGWPLIPLVLLNLALFMIPEDLRFASAGKIRRAGKLYRISLVLNIALWVLGVYLLFIIGFLGFFVLYIAGMNLAIANKVGRALKNIDRHPTSPLVRSAEESRALDAAMSWEKVTYFADFALAGYIGFMLVGTAQSLAPVDFWIKWMGPAVLIVAASIIVRKLRKRALEGATQAAVVRKGDGAVVTREAIVLDDSAVPAVVRNVQIKHDKKPRRQNGFIGEAPVRRASEDTGAGGRPNPVGLRHRMIQNRASGYGQWVILCVWGCLVLCGYYLLTSVSFYPSALSYKLSILVVGLSTAFLLWLMAARIRRAPRDFASKMSRKTFLDRLFVLGSLFLLGPLLLSMPLYACAYGVHVLTAQADIEMHQINLIENSKACVELQSEGMRFCIRNPHDFAEVVQEHRDPSFAIRRSLFGVSVDAHIPWHGVRE